MKNVSVFAFATFGSPNGFTQSCIYGNKSLEKILKTFDLKTNAIQLLSPNDRIYAIRKELVQNNAIISYSVYTFAKEKNSNRGGTFIGTSLVFTNQIPGETKILNALHGIHQSLKNNNVSANILNVIHSKDFKIDQIFPNDFEKLSFDTNKINFSDWSNSEQNLVVFVDKLDQNTIQSVFKKSLFLLSDYYTIYVIDSKEIADFVTQKRLFKIVNFGGLDQEIQNLENEKKQKLLNKIDEFEKVKKVLEENRRKQYEEFETKIKENQEKQAENRLKIDKSKSDLNTLNIIYQDFASNISAIIDNLKSNNKLEEANQLYRKQKSNFDQELNKIGTISSIQTISEPKKTSSFPKHSSENSSYSKSENSHQKKEPKLDISKIISFVLNFLLIVGITVFLLFFNDKKQEEIVTEIPNTAQIISNSDSLKTKLNPFPDDNLNAKDYKLVNKTLEKNATINDVVDLIFEKNPTSIGSIYKFQKEDYKNLLLEKNPKAFVKLNDSVYFVRDSVKIIPSLKVKK